MTQAAPPSSPAGHTTRADEQARAEPPLRKPGAGDVVAALLAGVPTVLFTTIVSAAVALALRVPGAQDLWVFAVIAVFPAIGMAVFIRRWVLSLRELMRDHDDVQWPFLAVPFFLVVGIALGVAFAFAVTHRG